MRYVPELREMIVVFAGSPPAPDKFDPNQIVPVRENDGFDNELRQFTKEFNGGSTRLARARPYLKGKVSGKYPLTLSHDSEKDTRKRLFQDIRPQCVSTLVYGDSSYRGVDAQSSGKLYVRLDKGLSYVMYGDYTTADTNPARSLSQYSRFARVRAHYEEGNVTANAFVARQALTQIVDEFPARGVSGPYSVSRSDGVAGSEKIEIRCATATRPATSSGHDADAFSGLRIRALQRPDPVPRASAQRRRPAQPGVDPRHLRGGPRGQAIHRSGRRRPAQDQRQTVRGGWLRRRTTTDAPFQVVGANLHLKLSKNTEIIAECQGRQRGGVEPLATSPPTTATTLLAPPVLCVRQCARVEIRHSDEPLRARLRCHGGQRLQQQFQRHHRRAHGVRRLRGGYQVNKRLSLNAEIQHSEDRISASKSDSASVGADLKLSDRLTVAPVPARPAKLGHPAAGPWQQLPGCGSGSGTTQGYNVVTASTRSATSRSTGHRTAGGVCNRCCCRPAATSLDSSSLYARATWKATDTVSVNGEVQREMGQGSTTLYRVAPTGRSPTKPGCTGVMSIPASSPGPMAWGWRGCEQSGHWHGHPVHAGWHDLQRIPVARRVGRPRSPVCAGVAQRLAGGGGLRLVTNVERLNTSSGGCHGGGHWRRIHRQRALEGSGRFGVAPGCDRIPTTCSRWGGAQSWTATGRCWAAIT